MIHLTNNPCIDSLPCILNQATNMTTHQQLKHHTYSKVTTKFPLSPTCSVIVRAQSHCGGAPCYTCPRVTVLKEHVAYMQRTENGEVPVYKNFAVHLTEEEFTSFKLVFGPANATLNFLDDREISTAYFASLSIDQRALQQKQQPRHKDSKRMSDSQDNTITQQTGHVLHV